MTTSASSVTGDLHAPLIAVQAADHGPGFVLPVTVTELPVTRCQICHRTVAYRLGEVLTGHYRLAHPEALGVPYR
jgi:hypothetical protein